MGNSDLLDLDFSSKPAEQSTQVAKAQVQQQVNDPSAVLHTNQSFPHTTLENESNDPMSGTIGNRKADGGGPGDLIGGV